MGKGGLGCTLVIKKQFKLQMAMRSLRVGSVVKYVALALTAGRNGRHELICEVFFQKEVAAPLALMERTCE